MSETRAIDLEVASEHMRFVLVIKSAKVHFVARGVAHEVENGLQTKN